MKTAVKISVFLAIFAITAAGCKKDNDNNSSGMQKILMRG